ncbi:MAG: uracil-DNA glycosylase [Desulfobacteraceae bacterium]|jgi:DNA polymerase
MRPPENLNNAITMVQNTLKQMAQWGCRGFDPSAETLAALARWRKPATPSETGPEMLEEVRSDLVDCQRCRLAGGRTHIVFGHGNPKARLVFVGEGPGAEEDRQGLPFVGAAGQLLTKIIEAMKLTRDQVYICNVIKCRPPGNRNPAPDEIAACRPYLERQLTAVKPEVICTLGTFAAQTLLNTTQPVSRLRGRFQSYKNIKVMPTYHPAYLLRNPERKRAVWDDMKKIMALLRIPL